MASLPWADRQRSQESVDGGIRRSVRFPVPKVQHPVVDGHFTIWRNHVDVVWLYAHAVLGLHHGIRVVRASISAYFALPRGIKMEHQDISHAQVRR